MCIRDRLYNRSDNSTLSNVITGTSGNLTFVGSGTTTVSGSSPFAGITTVDGTAAVITGDINGSGAGRFIVGNASSGSSLTFQSGGLGSAASMQIGNTNTSSNNTVTVTNASLSMVGTLGVGAKGNSGNQLLVLGGGTVTSGNIFVGLDGGGSNALLISGANAIVTADGNSGLGNFIGNNSSGNSLVISNGGTFNAIGRLYIGENGGTNNSVIVTGAGSLLTNTASNNSGITIGDTNGSGGTLTVASNATVAGPSISIANASNSTGVLNIGLYGANGTAAVSYTHLTLPTKRIV